MKKINTAIVMLTVIGTLSFILSAANAQNPTTDNAAQIFNDEGYGNEDMEYYNSEDDVVAVDEPSTASMPQNQLGNDVQK